MGKTAQNNLKIFKELCGVKGFGNARIFTTYWNRIDENVGAIHEAALKDGPFNRFLTPELNCIGTITKSSLLARFCLSLFRKHWWNGVERWQGLGRYISRRGQHTGDERAGAAVRKGGGRVKQRDRRGQRRMTESRGGWGASEARGGDSACEGRSQEIGNDADNQIQAGGYFNHENFFHDYAQSHSRGNESAVAKRE